MTQVKIIKNKTTELLERDINEFIQRLEYESINKYIVDIKNIELSPIQFTPVNPHSSIREQYVAMILYNLEQIHLD